MLIDEAFTEVKNQNSSIFQELTIKEIRVGMHLTTVQLSDGSVGLSATLTENYGFIDKPSRDFSDFTPLQIEGKPIVELFETTKNSALIRTLKVATLNALTAGHWFSGSVKVLRNTDPFDLVTFLPHQKVTIVGAFHSYISKTSEAVKELKVLELNREALHPDHLKYYVPANEFRHIIPESDVVVITGLTLVNETLDGILSVVNPKSQVIVTGPSSGIPPKVLFKHHVKMVGATYITQPEKLFKLVTQGATGFHLFRYCAEKICILPH